MVGNDAVLALHVGRSEVGESASWTRGLGLDPEGGHGLERRGTEVAVHFVFGGTEGLGSSRAPLGEARILGKCLQPGGGLGCPEV